MIDITRRRFKLKNDSEIAKKIIENTLKMKEVNQKISDFSKFHGACETTFMADTTTGEFVGLRFLENAPDRHLFKKLKNGSWIPKKNNKEAKAIYEEMKALPNRISSQVIFSEMTGLSTSRPVLFYGAKAYHCQIFGFSESENAKGLLAYLSVPWGEVSLQDVEAVKKGLDFDDSNVNYRKKELINWIIEFDKFLEEFGEQFEEMASWEVEKELEDFKKKREKNKE